MKTLFDQLTSTELKHLAILIGFSKSEAGFRNVLREIEALPKYFTMGDAAIAYFEHQLKTYKAYKAELEVDALIS